MSAARDIMGPWLSRESMESVPDVRRNFDLNRDPYIARQLRDLDLPESKRREDQASGAQSGGQKEKRKRSASQPALTIPPPANTQRPKHGWLAAQRQAVMAAPAAPGQVSERGQHQRNRIQEPEM